LEFEIKVKWFFNDEIPQVDNCKCVMAGDTYSFVIQQFEEHNVGRYTLVAENQHGKATCSSEIILEGGEFTTRQHAEEYSSKIVSGSDFMSDVEFRETKQVLPVTDLSTSQSTTFAEKKESSHLTAGETREIQIQTEFKDSGYKMEKINTKDESSQWMTPPEMECDKILVANESAPFMATKTQEARFKSSNADQSSMHASYSFTQQSVSYGGSSLVDTSPHVDFSTTLIKDINQHHYEPIQLIINRSDSFNHASNLSSSTYVRDIDRFHNRTSLNRFEPINLIVQKPYHRAGSLPPLISRLNFRSSAAAASAVRSDFEFTDTDDDSSAYYYYADRFDNKENYRQSKMTYYKEIAGKQRQLFKPVELVLDASSISEYHHGKRHRDTSLPSIKRMRMPIRHQHLKASSFIYDNNNDFENESTLSDFISDRAHEQRESKFNSSFNRQSAHHYSDERERHIKIEQKLPAMEMTIDLKAPPTIESHLKNVSVYEGQMAKLECVLSGKMIFQLN